MTNPKLRGDVEAVAEWLGLWSNGHGSQGYHKSAAELIEHLGELGLQIRPVEPTQEMVDAAQEHDDDGFALAMSPQQIYEAMNRAYKPEEEK